MKKSILNVSLTTADSKSIKTDLYLFHHPVFKRIIAFKDDDQVWFSLNHVGDILGVSSETSPFIGQSVISDDNKICITECKVLEDSLKIFINTKGIEQFCQFRRYACSILLIEQFKKFINEVLVEMESADTKSATIVVDNDNHQKTSDEEQQKEIKEVSVSNTNGSPFTIKTFKHELFGELLVFIDSDNKAWFWGTSIRRIFNSNTLLTVCNRLKDKKEDVIRVDIRKYMDYLPSYIGNDSQYFISIKVLTQYITSMTKSCTKPMKLVFAKWLKDIGYPLTISLDHNLEIKDFCHDTFGTLYVIIDSADNNKVWFEFADIMRLTNSNASATDFKQRNQPYYRKIEFDNNRLYVTKECVYPYIIRSNLSNTLKQQLIDWIDTIAPISDEEQKELDRLQIYQHDKFGKIATYTDENDEIWFLAHTIYNILTVRGTISKDKFNRAIYIDLYKFSRKVTDVFALRNQVFISKEDVAKLVNLSRLNTNLNQEFCKWIDSITPVFDTGIERHDSLLAFENKEFGQLIVYINKASNDNKIWYLFADIQKFIPVSSAKTRCMATTSKEISKEITKVYLDEFLKASCPSYPKNVNTSNRSFITKEGIQEIIHRIKVDFKKDELYQWISDIEDQITKTSFEMQDQETSSSESDNTTTVDKKTTSLEQNINKWSSTIYHHDSFGDLAVFYDAAGKAWFVYVQISKIFNCRSDLALLYFGDEYQVNVNAMEHPHLRRVLTINANPTRKLISSTAVLKIITSLRKVELKRVLDFMKWLDSIGIRLYEDGPSVNEFDYHTCNHETFGKLIWLKHNTTGKAWFLISDVLKMTNDKMNSCYISETHIRTFPFDSSKYVSKAGLDLIISKSKKLDSALKEQLQNWIDSVTDIPSTLPKKKSGYAQMFTHETFGDLVTYKDLNGKLWYLGTDILASLDMKRDYNRIANRIKKAASPDSYLNIDLYKLDDINELPHSQLGLGQTRTFISKTMVSSLIVSSPLDQEHKKKFAEWILSIDPLSEKDLQELEQIQVFTHDTFGDLVVHKDSNDTIYFLLSDIYKLFNFRSTSTAYCGRGPQIYSKYISINPLAILSHPTLHMTKFDDRNFISYQFLNTLYSYSRRPSKTVDEIRNWIDSIVRQLSPNGIIDTTTDTTIVETDDDHSYNLYNTRVIAKDFGFSPQQLNSLLYRLGVIYPLNVYPQVWGLYQQYSVKGYAMTKKELIEDPISGEKKSVGLVTKWTLRGRDFIHDLLAQYGIYPVNKQEEHMQEENTVPQPIMLDELVVDENNLNA